MTIADVLSGAARWHVETGDCLNVLPTIDRVDHVITDPPYEAEAHTNHRMVIPEFVSTSDRPKRWHRRGGQTVRNPIRFGAIDSDTRILSSAHFARIASRWVLIFCQVEAVRLWQKWGVRHGLRYKRTCIWVKPDGMPQLTGDRPGMGYEVFVAMYGSEGRSRWNGNGRNGVFVHQKDFGGGAGIRNDHPTQKPLALMMELVELFTEPDDVVLDPFAGNTTTGLACLRLGRRFIGIERDEAYAAMARERLQAEDGANTVHGLRAKQTALFGGSR